MMNEFHFEDFEVGVTASFDTDITENMMKKFLDVCDDTNPMHMDDTYALKYGYSSRLVYGMLTASFYSKLAGCYLPGKFCILKSVESFFERPVYIGDTLTVTGRVKEKDERFKQATVKARIKNQHGETVSKANILVGFYE